jgi:hypothetical protein
LLPAAKPSVAQLHQTEPRPRRGWVSEQSSKARINIHTK